MGHSRGSMDSDDSGRYPISQRVSPLSSKVPTIQGGHRELAGVPTLSACLWRLYVFVGIFLPGVYALRSRVEIRKLQHLNSDDSVRCDALFQTLAGGTRFNPCRGIARRACVRNPFIYLRGSNSLARGDDDGYSGSSLPTLLGRPFVTEPLPSTDRCPVISSLSMAWKSSSLIQLMRYQPLTNAANWAESGDVINLSSLFKVGCK